MNMCGVHLTYILSKAFAVYKIMSSKACLDFLIEMHNNFYTEVDSKTLKKPVGTL